jgi:hypothetical protein
MLAFLILFVGGFASGMVSVRSSGPLKVVHPCQEFVRITFLSICLGVSVALVFGEKAADTAFWYSTVAWISGWLGALENAFNEERKKASNEGSNSPD